MQRRSFLKSSLAGSLAAGTVSAKGLAEPQQPGGLVRRPLGETGEHLSVVGLGGIVVRSLEQSEADRHVAQAIERGINYFDVAPTYGDAQDRLGPALEPYRKGVFLACKTTKRDQEGAAAELENSLKVLRTDHFDVYQLHGLQNVGEVETAFGPRGAMETFVRAKEQGKTRFLGFSAHSVQAALAAMARYDFDTVLFPINYVLSLKEKFGPQVIEKASEKGMGILALKALARSRATRENKPFAKCWYIPETEPEAQELAVRFTLSQPDSWLQTSVQPGSRVCGAGWLF